MLQATPAADEAAADTDLSWAAFDQQRGTKPRQAAASQTPEQVAATAAFNALPPSAKAFLSAWADARLRANDKSVPDLSHVPKKDRKAVAGFLRALHRKNVQNLKLIDKTVKKAKAKQARDARAKATAARKRASGAARQAAMDARAARQTAGNQARLAADQAARRRRIGLAKQARDDIQLAAVAGHHVPGSAYHWRHNWHPLDVRTATLYRKRLAAKQLHAAGAPHYIPEPDEKGFHEGVKPVPGGLSIAEKPKAPPEPKKPEPPAVDPFADNSKALKAYIKTLPAEIRTKRHLWSGEQLVHASVLGDEKAAAHHEARTMIEKRYVTDRAAERENWIARQRASGMSEEDIARLKPYAPYSEAELRDLERRTVLAGQKRAKIEKDREDAKKAREAAKAAREADPERLQKLTEDLTAKNGNNRYQWPPEDLQKLIEAGDTSAIYQLETANRRAKKAVKYNKAAAEREQRRGERNSEGDPVSKAVRNQTTGKTREGVEHAMAMIDKVHHDGDLYPIPVKNSQATRRYGQYTFRSTNTPGLDDDITVSAGGDHHATTYAHEVGHWLDRRAIGGNNQAGAGLGSQAGFQSARAANAGHHILGAGMQPAAPPEWAAWWSAVDSSEAIKGMRTTKSVPGSLKYRNYTLTPEEMWARSYAQYIATRSGSPKMQQEIRDLVALREAGDHRTLQGYSQWTDEDFAPIATAIDGILRARGWMR